MTAKEIYRAFELLAPEEKDKFLTILRKRIRPLDSSEKTMHSQTLQQIEYILMVEDDIETATRRVLEVIKENLGYDHLAIGLKSDRDRVRFPAFVGYEKGETPEELHIGEGVTGYAMERAESVNIPDVYEDSRYIKALNGIRSEVAIPIFADKSEVMGVLNAESHHVDAFSDADMGVLTSVANQFSVAIRNAIHRRERDELQEHLQKAYLGTLHILADFLEKQFPHLEGHSHRVAELTVILGERMDLSREDLKLLRIAGELHDLGKIDIPREVLNKPGPLDDDERTLVQQHPIAGSRMMSSVPLHRDQVSKWIRYHHERFDGSGYPDGLKGEEIPLPARIIAVADAWDAMTSERPYRHALGKDEATRELREWSGRQFDGTVVAAMIDYLKETGAIGD